jgi:hypothetical protein
VHLACKRCCCSSDTAVECILNVSRAIYGIGGYLDSDFFEYVDPFNPTALAK